MNHPKSTDILKVINNFKKVEAYASSPGSVKMSNSSLMGKCLCHAGWYFYATASPFEQFLALIFSPLHFFTGYQGWQMGADKMAKDLGFNNSHMLAQWAGRNHIIWGNFGGGLMFLSKCAFIRGNKKLGLTMIINHWTGVYERIKEAEERREKLIQKHKDIAILLASYIQTQETVDLEDFVIV